MKLSDIESIHDVKRYYAIHVGGSWFYASTMNFWGTRIYDEIFHDPANERVMFVTSEHNFDRTERLYTVRAIYASGRIATVGEFQQYACYEDARNAASREVES